MLDGISTLIFADGADLVGTLGDAQDPLAIPYPVTIAPRPAEEARLSGNSGRHRLRVVRMFRGDAVTAEPNF